ncbi:cysteine hydrolase [Tunicatimonas pelagia]|uniref:cysteine hydrolase n=1 Tax=Tunicatimonas pelagia TaxID=931531 RepID=UPI002666F68B|nr:cysteine hydrolase [Tunicatimonas pelagia]WKN44990.1 cysteine hydrolase [Tunicatimonas pelagia]
MSQTIELMIQKIKFSLLMATILNSSLAFSQNVYDSLQLDSSNTAIIVIEFQKTWTQKGNFLNRLIRKPLRKNKIIPKTKSFLDSARQRGYTIIHTPLILDKNNKEEYRKMPFMPKLMGAFTANTWKAEFEEGIRKDTDIVAVGRTGFDACEGSNLQELVQGYQNLLVAGFLTDQCVEATMKTLKKNGHNCIMISNGTATNFKSVQRKVEKRNHSIKTDELLTVMN